MRLKNQVEWALHCCSVLSAVPDQYVSTRTLAEFHGIPKEYLSKALQALAQAGLVVGTLGPSGGYRLKKPAAEISFLDIVEAVEGREPSFTCTEIRQNNPCRTDRCTPTRPCAVARVMWQADRAWRDSLRCVTLADLSATLQQDIPAEQHAATREWLRKKA